MTSQPRKVAFCRTCNARERAIVDGRCIVCGCDPKVERCPRTGRSATACDSPDHRNCPDLRPQEGAMIAINVNLGEHYADVLRILEARGCEVDKPWMCLAECPDDSAEWCGPCAAHAALSWRPDNGGKEMDR